MKSALAMLMTASLLMVGGLGCEREISSETKVKDSPNQTKIEEKKTVEKPDGSVETRKETKTVNK
jgi:hypothetical protein